MRAVGGRDSLVILLNWRKSCAKGKEDSQQQQPRRGDEDAADEEDRSREGLQRGRVHDRVERAEDQGCEDLAHGQQREHPPCRQEATLREESRPGPFPRSSLTHLLGGNGLRSDRSDADHRRSAHHLHQLAWKKKTPSVLQSRPEAHYKAGVFVSTQVEEPILVAEGVHEEGHDLAEARDDSYGGVVQPQHAAQEDDGHECAWNQTGPWPVSRPELHAQVATYRRSWWESCRLSSSWRRPRSTVSVSAGTGSLCWTRLEGRYVSENCDTSYTPQCNKYNVHMWRHYIYQIKRLREAFIIWNTFKVYIVAQLICRVACFLRRWRVPTKR